LSERFGVSVNTVREAYILLETQRFIEVKPRSGYYVRRMVPPVAGHARSMPTLDPREVTMCRIYGELVDRRDNRDAASFAIALPDPALLPVRRLERAFLSIPNFNNPLGFLVSDERKRALVDLLERFQVPPIEDDLYGELPFAGKRPSTCKGFDKTGNVILFSASGRFGNCLRLNAGIWNPAVENAVRRLGALVCGMKPQSATT
jgi:DNA-binding transcriptional MocR family regulator